MIINEIRIYNFKSIEDISFRLQSYGSNSKLESQAMILVGINECGKSNILEAVNSVNHKFEAYNYNTTYCKLGDKENSDLVDIQYYFDFDAAEYLKIFKSKYKVPDALMNLLVIESIHRDIYIDEDEKNDNYFLELGDHTFWHLFVVEKRKLNFTSKDGTVLTREIIEINPLNAQSSANITKETAKQYLKDGQELLTKYKCQSLLLDIAKEKIEKEFPNIIYWKSTPEQLINDQISLKEFKENPDISLPLKNIFSIYGKKTNDEIKKTIDLALREDEFKTELEEDLTKTITQHINRIWKEHKIRFKIKFDADICKVHVEDLSVKNKFYKMEHRSDGFKQFVSLMLSLSAQNDSDLLKNNIILLDEPEVHLHPSGVKYLRDEILKIGKKNQVIVATHSHYLIDTKVPERHWIVEKDKVTRIKQIENSENLFDDEVISKAFGLNLLKELVPDNILIVEGYGDKSILNHLFKLLEKQISYNIKNAAGASKVYSFASLIAEEKINSIILLDDDDEGRQVKKEIILKLKNHFNKNNVFTLKDIFEELPDKATIEDLYPLTFINEILSNELNKEVNFISEKPIISQLKIFDNTYQNKEKLDKLKTKLSEALRKKYVNKKLITKEQRLHTFCEELSKRLISDTSN